MAGGFILESPGQVGPPVAARRLFGALERHPGLTRVEDAPSLLGRTALDLFRIDAP